MDEVDRFGQVNKLIVKKLTKSAVSSGNHNYGF